MAELWLCEESHCLSYIEAREDTERRLEAESQRNTQTPKVEAQSSILQTTTNLDGILKGVIPISGVLSKSGPSELMRFFGFEGTAYLDIIKAASEAKGMAEVRLIIDSPGGDVDGVDMAFQAIRSLAESGTKVIAEVQGIALSAAYWIASAADEIVASSPSDLVGSIGIVLVQVDRSEQDKKYGKREIKVISRNAPEKQSDANTEQGLETLQKLADSLERVFISRVAQGRGVSDEFVRNNFGRGSAVIAQDPDKGNLDALDRDMIDRIEGQSLIVEASPPKWMYDDEEESKAASNNAKPIAAKEKTMTLEEMLRDNPQLAAQIEEMKTTAYNAGVSAERDRVSRIIPVLASPDYPEQIKATAKEVFEGKASSEMFIGQISAYDMFKAEKKMTEAKDETTNAEATPAQAEVIKAREPQPEAVASWHDNMAVLKAARGIRTEV
jgi:ClpP class serine protease